VSRRQLLLVDDCEHVNYTACLPVRTIGLELTVSVRNMKTESDWSSNTRARACMYVCVRVCMRARACVCVCGCWRGLSALARLLVKHTTDN
jgi:hypothetical protein